MSLWRYTSDDGSRNLEGRFLHVAGHLPCFAFLLSVDEAEGGLVLICPFALRSVELPAVIRSLAWRLLERPGSSG